ncbi:MAG: glutamyl-tRNA reductase [Chloroflexota bacterium]
MSIILVGLNHNTAPVSLREQLSLSGCALDMALEEFRHTFMGYPPAKPDGFRLTEGAFLSTCNRLEMYAVCSSDTDEANHQSWQYMTQFLASLQGTNLELLTQHLYFKAGRDAIQHLMRVACGLDSLILGEPQIMGQVAYAYREAHAVQTTGPILSHLFNQAMHTGKRARTETDISRHTTSVSHAAARLASQELGNLPEQKILIVGAGEMAQLAAQAMTMHDAQNLTIINRTYSGATELAMQVGGVPMAWHQIEDALIETDLVVTATGAPHIVIDREQVEKIVPKRGGRTLLFMDIAVPRDVDESVGSLDGVVCYDVDDLQAAVDENMAQRQAELPKVNALIREEVSGMLDWLSQRAVVPVIVDIRSKAQEIAALEVADAKRRLRRINDQSTETAEALIDRLAHRLVNKLMHDPVIQLKHHAAAGDGHEYAFMLRDLFKLSTDSTSAETLSDGVSTNVITNASNDKSWNEIASGGIVSDGTKPFVERVSERGQERLDDTPTVPAVPTTHPLTVG